MRVGLALGGGAIRGLAHLGVLSVLEHACIPVDCVAASSVGSLIGAVYCAGFSAAELLEIASNVNWLTFASPTWSRHGFVSFDRMTRWLTALLGDPNFDDLPIPFAIVATDMNTGEPVVLNDQRVAPAVQASCTLPGIVKPIRRNGRFLIDGGVSDNVPVSILRAMGADFIIGVDVCRPSFDRRVGPVGISFGAIETLVQRAGGGCAAADCLISPDLAGFSYVSFSRKDELIARGKSATEEALPAIQATLANTG